MNQLAPEGERALRNFGGSLEEFRNRPPRVRLRELDQAAAELATTSSHGVDTLFGTITPPPPAARGLFDDTRELAVTADPAPPAARRTRERATVDAPGTGGELFALELAEGTPETGFVFGVGDL